MNDQADDEQEQHCRRDQCKAQSGRQVVRLCEGLVRVNLDEYGAVAQQVTLRIRWYRSRARVLLGLVETVEVGLSLLERPLERADDVLVVDRRQRSVDPARVRGRDDASRGAAHGDDLGQRRPTPQRVDEGLQVRLARRRFAGGDDGEGDVHRAVTEALVCDAFPDDRRCQKSTYRVGDGKERDRKEQSAAEGVETAAGGKQRRGRSLTRQVERGGEGASG